MHFLWSNRHRDLFRARSFRESPRARRPARLRTSFRLIPRLRRVECICTRVRHPDFQLTLILHRFEKIIGGRPYVIEVAPIADRRWRAHIVRIPGVPTALMPFYGETPDEAASHLSEWLTRVHRSRGGYGIVRPASRPTGRASARVPRRSFMSGRSIRFALSLASSGALALASAAGLAQTRTAPDGPARAADRHWRHDQRAGKRGHPAVGRGDSAAGARGEPLRTARGRAVRQRGQHRADAGSVDPAGRPPERAVRSGRRAGRRRRHLRHRLARGTGLLPAPDRAQPQAGGGRGRHAQRRHARLRGRRQPARRLSRGGAARVARPGRDGRPQRRDPLRARGHQDRRAAPADLPERQLRPDGHRRSGPRRLLPRPAEAAHP